MSRGGLIALSGVDCGGKSTQRDLLVQALRSWGARPVLVYLRPGYTPGLRTVKSFLQRRRKDRARNGEAERPGRYPRRAENLGHPLVRWLWLQTALLDLLVQSAVRMRLWRAQGRVVVCNRYLLDALVDFRVNFPAERVEERWLCRALRRFAPRPDAAFCLLVSPEESAERAIAKTRFHRETPEVLHRRWREYLALSEDLGVQSLDGRQAVDEIAVQLQQRVAEALGSSGPDCSSASSRAPSASVPADAKPIVDLRDWPLPAPRRE